MNQSLAHRNPQLHAKLSHLSLPLSPLVALTSGRPHPHFPTTLLQYHLLTSSQLDSLASFYHQASPSEWSYYYPCPVVDNWVKGEREGKAGIEDKRRRFGRFIGLRGCEMPVREGFEGVRVQSEEEIRRDVQRSRERGDVVEEVRRKMGWY